MKHAYYFTITSSLQLAVVKNCWITTNFVILADVPFYPAKRGKMGRVQFKGTKHMFTYLNCMKRYHTYVLMQFLLKCINKIKFILNYNVHPEIVLNVHVLPVDRGRCFNVWGKLGQNFRALNNKKY